MGWNNYEVIREEETISVSYEGFCEEIINNAKRMGMNQAIEQFVKKEFNLEGNINGIREHRNSEWFLSECDEAYSILFVALRAIVDCAIPSLPDRRAFYNCLSDGNVKNIQDIMNINIVAINGIKSRNPRLDGLDALKRLKSGKSVMRSCLDEMDKIIQVYCNNTGKKLPQMRRNIFTTMYQGYCLLLDADNVEKNESFLSWLSVGVNVLNKSKMERIEKPFSYYLDSLE